MTTAVAHRMMSLTQVRPGVYVLDDGVLYRIERVVKGQVLLEAVVGRRGADGNYPRRWVGLGWVSQMGLVYEGDA